MHAMQFEGSCYNIIYFISYQTRVLLPIGIITTKIVELVISKIKNCASSLLVTTSRNQNILELDKFVHFSALYSLEFVFAVGKVAPAIANSPPQSSRNAVKLAH